MELIEILKSLADETRLRIINILRSDELCVCEIEVILELKQANTSKHLNKLKSTNLIKGEKKAQWVYYKLNNDILKKYGFIDSIINRELEQFSIFQRDRNKLNKYKESGLTCEDIKVTNYNNILKENDHE